MTAVKEFKYSVRQWKIILAMLFFAVCGAFFFREAITNHRGLIINGMIRLNTGQAAVFWYVWAGISCLFVLRGATGMILEMLYGQKLIIYSDGLGLPVRKKNVRLLFSEIASARVMDVYGTRIIEFVTKDNKKYSIPDIKFGSKAEFDEVFALISGGIKK